MAPPQPSLVVSPESDPESTALVVVEEAGSPELPEELEEHRWFLEEEGEEEEAHSLEVEVEVGLEVLVMENEEEKEEGEVEPCQLEEEGVGLGQDHQE